LPINGDDGELMGFIIMLAAGDRNGHPGLKRKHSLAEKSREMTDANRSGHP
jgi:hypothetical protein